MSMPWFRLYSEFATDPVVQSLAFEDQRHFVVLMCLKSNGVLDRQIPLASRNRIICRGLGLDSAAADEAKRRLMEVGLIDKNWQIPAWDKRQFISDDTTSRVRKHRKNKQTGNVTETLLKRDCNGPDTDTDISPNGDTCPQDAGMPSCPQQQILDLYHETLPELRRMRVWNDARAKDLRARWRQSKDHQSLDWWRRLFLYVRQCPFLMGQRKDWSADLAWLVRADNFSKVINGNYQEAA